MLSSERPRHFLKEPCPSPCAICPNRDNPRQIVHCDGPADARVLCIGEKPGINEDSTGRPFVGRSGEEFNTRYLPLAGLNRNDIMVANSVRCWVLNGGENPTKEQARICAAHHLPHLIERMPNLEYVVPMGGVAWSLVDDQPRDIDVQHGYHLIGRMLGMDQDFIIHPTLHPAAGLHKPDEIAKLRDDFRRLYRLLAGEWLTPYDEYPDTDYREGIWDFKSVWEHRWAASGWPPYIAIDTEQDSGKEWCLTWSIEPGTGYLLRAGTKEAAKFAKLVQHYRGRIFMHYAMHDQRHLKRFPIPIDIPWENVIDTMQLAFNRCLPQGLKALAYRLCGVDMKEYNDVVRPYAEAKMFRYVAECTEALIEEAGKKAMILQMVRDLAPPAVYKGKKVQRKHNEAWIDRVIGDYGIDLDQVETVQAHLHYLLSYVQWHEKGSKAPWLEIGDIVKKKEAGADVRPFERWKRIRERRPEIHDACKALVGKQPSAGISEVPFDEALVYACRDADTTLRVGLRMLEQEGIPQV